MHSLRTRWQITMVFGVTTAMLIAGLLHIPRRMWIGIAAMSILVPFHEDAKQRAKSQSSGQYCWMLRISGTVLFLAAVCLQLCGCHWRDWCRSFGNLWMSGNFQYLWGVIYCCWNPWIARGDILPNF